MQSENLTAKEAAKAAGSGQRYECWCSRTFESAEDLEAHAVRSGCVQLATAALAMGRSLPSEEVNADAQRAGAQERERASKRIRMETTEDARRARVSLALANFRYKKMIAGSTVDMFKSFHEEENKLACEFVEAELTHRLGELIPTETLACALQTIKSSFDTYAGLRNEKAENRVLVDQVQLPILKYHERKLGATSGYAYDFDIEESVLLLMKHVPAARAEVFSTVMEWAVHPPSQDESRRVIADITDGSVFLDHPVLGTKCRVPREQAEKCSDTLPIRIAILLYWDGFTVCARALRPTRRHAYA